MHVLKTPFFNQQFNHKNTDINKESYLNDLHNKIYDKYNTVNLK